MPAIRLHLFGPPRLLQGSEARALAPRKAGALLAYLAVEGGAQSRDGLAALLWPEADRQQGRSNLRNLLWLLGKTLGDGGLRLERETVELEAGFLEVDVLRFLRLLAEAEELAGPTVQACAASEPLLTEAVALYGSPFLAGFGLRDSVPFDEWQGAVAAHLERQCASALGRLAALARERGEWTRVTELLEQRLRLDPLDEGVLRELMAAHAAAGRRPEALRRYAAFARLLHEELGISPTPETLELQRSIAEGETTPRGPVVAPPPLDLPVLVGRDEEWGKLRRTYEAMGESGFLLVLGGEEGIGKSRLAEEFVRSLEAQGAWAVRLRCFQGEGRLAYGPFVDGLESVLVDRGRRAALASVPEVYLNEAGRLLPQLGENDLPPGAVDEGPGAQRRFFEGMAQTVIALCSGGPPGVLLVDDLHWADGASLELLGYLLRRLSGRPLLVLATWREELVPHGHPLRTILAEMQRARRALHLRQPRLQRPAVLELLSRPGFPAGLADPLLRETEGVPLLLVEYLRDLAERGAGAAEEPLDLPHGARTLLAARLAAVDETARPALLAAAAFGRPADPELLAEVAGIDLEGAVRALEALLSLGLMHETRSSAGDPEYGFRHDKLRHLAYDETSSPRKLLLHRRIAGALESRAREDPGPLSGQIARHHRLGGQDAQAAAWYLRAARHARSLHAHGEALEHLRSALELGLAPSSEVIEELGDLLTLLGRYGEALERYAEALAAAPERRAPLEHKRGTLYARLGEWERAEEAYAVAAQEVDDAGRAALLADWSMLAHQQGDRRQAEDRAEAALRHAERTGGRRELARAHNILGILARTSLQEPRAQAHFERALALAADSGDPFARVAALNNLALLHGSGGRSEKALELATEALAACTALGDRHREAALHSNIADLLHASGRSGEAMEHLKRSARIYAEISDGAAGWRPELWKLIEW